MYSPTYGGAPPYSMGHFFMAGPSVMPPVTPGVDTVHGGLGFWSALVPIGTSIIGGAIGGDPSAIDKRDYYAQVKTKIWCPERSAAPLDVVDSAIANLDPFSGEGGRLRQAIVSQLAVDRTWEELGIARPRGSRQEAAVLINAGNGWRYCPGGGAVGGTNLEARNLVDRLLAHEEARQRTLMEAARERAAQAAQVTQTFVAGPPVVAGVPNVALLGGLGLVAVLLLRGRR